MFYFYYASDAGEELASCLILSDTADTAQYSRIGFGVLWVELLFVAFPSTADELTRKEKMERNPFVVKM